MVYVLGLLRLYQAHCSLVR